MIAPVIICLAFVVLFAISVHELSSTRKPPTPPKTDSTHVVRLDTALRHQLDSTRHEADSLRSWIARAKPDTVTQWLAQRVRHDTTRDTTRISVPTYIIRGCADSIASCSRVTDSLTSTLDVCNTRATMYAEAARIAQDRPQVDSSQPPSRTTWAAVGGLLMGIFFSVIITITR